MTDERRDERARLTEALERAKQHYKRIDGLCVYCADIWPCDAAILAAEVERLAREVATAILMRDAWMHEYNRIQQGYTITTSSSSTNLPRRVDDTPPVAADGDEGA